MMMMMMMPSTLLFVATFLFGLLPWASSLSIIPSNIPREPSNTKEYAPHLRAKIAGSVAKGERRAGERAGQLRQVCGGCSRPEALCVCDVLPDQKLITKTRILILQHPNERRKKNFSTVPLLRLVLENVQVLVGYEFDADQIAPVKELISKGQKPLLLYPSPEAISLDNLDFAALSSSEKDINSSNDTIICSDDNNDQDNLLIIVDGTWMEAKRIMRESPSLVQHCQKVQFTSDSTSIYDAVRKEPEAHCLSTLEACAKALELLENNNHNNTAMPAKKATTNYLHAILQSHVDSHLVNANMMAPRSAGQSTQKLYAKNQRRREIELELFEPTMETNRNGDDEALPTTTILREFGDGSIMRPLQLTDTAVVDSWWESRSNKSLPLVKRRIERDKGPVCLGVEDKEGPLVACILRYEGGALGMLHVHEPFRRRGYGLALLKQATRTLQERGEERVAFIMDGNHASEAVFTAAGWKRDDPTAKRRTGKRRAKRKWIHASDQ
jgi:DTW domain-containing protein YfiP/GNAT superfamily N-acetyltransferase